MGPLYWEWIKQYTATDQLLSMMFIFGACMMFGYYAAPMLPWDPKVIRWIQRLQAATILGIITLTLAAPGLLDLGLITME